VLGRQAGVGEAEPVQERRIELRLERPDRHVPAVGAGVDVVERGAAVQEVRPALVGPHALAAQRPEHLGEQADAVHHRGVHHLPAAGPLPLHQRGEDADQHQHRSAPEVGDQVSRDHGRPAGPPEGVQRPGERQVVEVVPGVPGPRPVLAPAGHPRVDQARRTGQAVLGPEAHPLGHPRAEHLDQDVGPLDQVQHQRQPLGRLHVGRDGAPVAQQRVAARVPDGETAGRAFHPDHVGAEVGQHHGGVRAGADPAELDHAQPGQRAPTEGSVGGLHASSRGR
jgi:hypothetical protein